MLRARMNLSQQQVAERLSVSQNQVGRLESGAAEPTASQIAALCYLFGVSADYMVGRSDFEQGLAPDSWIVDLDTVQSYMRKGWLRRLGSKDTTWAAKIPRRYVIVDYERMREIEQQGFEDGDD